MARFTLKGTLQLDGRQWNAGLEQARRSTEKWSNNVVSMIRSKMAGAFAAGAIIRTATASLDRAGTIRDKSNALGIPMSVYQQLDFAAAQTGASIENMTVALKRLSVAQIDATNGSKDALDTFTRLGISTEDLANLAPDQLFFKIAEIFRSNQGSSADIANAQKILGRSGSDLLPAFRSGLSNFAQQAVDAGVIIPDDEVLRLAAASDKKTTAEFKASRAVATGTAAFIQNPGGIGTPLAVFPKLYNLLSPVIRAYGEQRREELRQQHEATIATKEIAENTRPLNQ